MVIYRLARRMSAPAWTQPVGIPNREARRAERPARQYRRTLYWWARRWWA